MEFGEARVREVGAAFGAVEELEDEPGAIQCEVAEVGVEVVGELRVGQGDGPCQGGAAVVGVFIQDVLIGLGGVGVAARFIEALAVGEPKLPGVLALGNAGFEGFESIGLEGCV